MAGKRPTKLTERRETVQLGDLTVPVRIITERGRRGTRASVTRQALIIRLPDRLSAADRERALREMLDWARSTYDKKPQAFSHFRAAPVAERYTITVRGRDYRIRVRDHDRRSHRILPAGEGRLLVELNPDDPRRERGELLPKLLAKYFGGLYRPEVAERVRELNEMHFRRPVREVKLSDTYARWGSCSSRGNINLATRLIQAPAEVLDAVIIHELAHLVEANHSPRFWAEVRRALPNYKEYDVWLRRHGGDLHFRPVPLA